MSAMKPGAASGSAIIIGLSLNRAVFNTAGLPSLSDDDHFTRAMASGQPHTYLAQRAGRMSYKGEEGLGFFNAERLHIRLFRQNGQANDMSDISEATRLSPSFKGAVQWIQRNDTAIYMRLANMMPHLDAGSKPAGYDLR